MSCKIRIKTEKHATMIYHFARNSFRTAIVSRVAPAAGILGEGRGGAKAYGAAIPKKLRHPATDSSGPVPGLCFSVFSRLHDGGNACRAACRPVGIPRTARPDAARIASAFPLFHRSFLPEKNAFPEHRKGLFRFEIAAKNIRLLIFLRIFVTEYY